MKIDSLAFQTELIFHKFTGIVFEYDDYVVVKTPTNPTYFWGNLVYFKGPPQHNSLSQWKALFNDHFATMNVNHMTFAWDSITGDTGDIQPYIADGFTLEKSSVMVTDNIVLPKKLNPELIVRPIVSEEDWALVLENHVACRAEHFEEKPYRKFAARKIADYRLMIKKNKGHWMGAFHGNQLAGDLGIFAENGLGRFQNVGTHPDFRRRGVCSTLLYHTATMALETMNVEKLVIVADPMYHALKIYESVGFKTTETFVGICKYNKSEWVT